MTNLEIQNLNVAIETYKNPTEHLRLVFEFIYNKKTVKVKLDIDEGRKNKLYKKIIITEITYFRSGRWEATTKNISYLKNIQKEIKKGN